MPIQLDPQLLANIVIPGVVQRASDDSIVHTHSLDLKDLPAPFNEARLWVSCHEAWPHTDPDYEGMMFISLVVEGAHRYSQLGEGNVVESIEVRPGCLFPTNPLALHWLEPLDRDLGFIALQWEVPFHEYEARMTDLADAIGGKAPIKPLEIESQHGLIPIDPEAYTYLPPWIPSTQFSPTQRMRNHDRRGTEQGAFTPAADMLIRSEIGGPFSVNSCLPEGFWHIERRMKLAPSKPARYITMSRQQPKFEVQDLVQLLADIRAPYIANEILGQAFKPQAHPLYIEYSLELLRQLLPVAALEKAYSGATFNHLHDTPDHLVCNRAVRMMLKMLDDAFYDQFKAEHPRMPKQLTVQEWGGFMLLLRSHDWHNGVPVYPRAGFGVDTSTPLDFITEEQCAMAHAAGLGIALLDHDPFDFASEIKGNYPNTSLSALVLVVTKAQSKQRVTHIVDTARGPAAAFVYHATIEQAEKGVDTAAEQWGWTLTHGERETAIQALHLAPPASSL